MHPSLTFPALYCRASGFTLIEVLIVLVIVAILTMVGVPQLADFIADQRVRTVASDIAREIALARATAIEQSRRVYFEKTGAHWNNGWRIYTDLNNSGTYDAGEEIKFFDGFSASSRLYVCTNVADFATNIVFRPDGRIMRGLGAAPTPNDGLYVIDTMGDANDCNNKVRGLLFGLSGRINVQILRSGAPGCLGVAPPCAQN